MEHTDINPEAAYSLDSAIKQSNYIGTPQMLAGHHMVKYFFCIGGREGIRRIAKGGGLTTTRQGWKFIKEILHPHLTFKRYKLMKDTQSYYSRKKK